MTARPRERASAIVLALVDGLSRLDGRHGGMIDTIRREEACKAILDLVRRYLVGALTPEETRWSTAGATIRSTSNSPASRRL